MPLLVDLLLGQREGGNYTLGVVLDRKAATVLGHMAARRFVGVGWRLDNQKAMHSVLTNVKRQPAFLSIFGLENVTCKEIVHLQKEMHSIVEIKR